MAPTRTTRSTLVIRTGIFVVLGILIFFGALFVLGERQYFFQNRVQVHAHYTDVAGLQEGAFVRIAGINVGTVDHIALPDTAGRVDVTFSIRSDALSQIRTDSRAIISTEGLIGARIVIITVGSHTMPPVRPGGFIAGQSPIRFHDYTQNIDRALEHVDDVVLNAVASLAAISSVMGKIDRGEGSLGLLVNDQTLHDTLMATMGRIHRLAVTSDRFVRDLDTTSTTLAFRVGQTLADYRDVADSLRVVSAGFHRTAGDISAIVDTVRQGNGLLGRLITDTRLPTALDTMLARTSNAIAEISVASHSVAQAAQQASTTIRQITSDIEQGRGTLGQLVTDDTLYVRLQRVVSNLDIASEKLAVNMEAVRTNWLFRGYFEEQGYWEDLNRKIELQEQRMIRLREWQERLLRLQQQLEEQERRLQQEEQNAGRVPAAPASVAPVNAAQP